MYSKTRAAGFGAEVKRRVMLGTYVLSAGYYDAYYGQAQKVRTLVRRDFEQAFERVDLLVAPTDAGAWRSRWASGEDPLQMYLNDIFTIPVNLAGAARGVDPRRLHPGRAADRAAAHRAAPSTRPRCCARPTPTRPSPTGTPAGRVLKPTTVDEDAPMCGQRPEEAKPPTEVIDINRDE